MIDAFATKHNVYYYYGTLILKSGSYPYTSHCPPPIKVIACFIEKAFKQVVLLLFQLDRILQSLLPLAFSQDARVIKTNSPSTACSKIIALSTECSKNTALSTPCSKFISQSTGCYKIIALNTGCSKLLI